MSSVPAPKPISRNRRIQRMRIRGGSVRMHFCLARRGLTTFWPLAPAYSSMAIGLPLLLRSSFARMATPTCCLQSAARETADRPICCALLPD